MCQKKLRPFVDASAKQTKQAPAFESTASFGTCRSPVSRPSSAGSCLRARSLEILFFFCILVRTGSLERSFSTSRNISFLSSRGRADRGHGGTVHRSGKRSAVRIAETHLRAGIGTGGERSVWFFDKRPRCTAVIAQLVSALEDEVFAELVQLREGRGGGEEGRTHEVEIPTWTTASPHRRVPIPPMLARRPHPFSGIEHFQERETSAVERQNCKQSDAQTCVRQNVRPV